MTNPKNWEIKNFISRYVQNLIKNITNQLFYTSEIIDNVFDENKWSIFYSRGIAYERINKWKKAEEDLKDGYETSTQTIRTLLTIWHTVG